MKSKRSLLLPGALAALLLGVAGASLAGADVDCAMCHDSAPVPASHMPVDDVSVDGCTMCHEASGDDAFFRAVHDKHGEALGCDTCHSDASAEHAAKLKEILGK